MSDVTHQGGCLCGAIRWEARGEADSLCFCHCASCRRAAGASPVAWGTFQLRDFTITRGSLSLHISSPPVVRGFCAACGTALTYRHEDRPDAIDVTLASFDDPSAAKPECHIWVSDRVDWGPLADGLPQYAGWRSAG
jgi:hypothetical protein